MEIFYTPKQVNIASNMSESTSKSPLKPKLVVEALTNGKFKDSINIHDDFSPLTKEDILIAHQEKYYDAFMNGEKPLCTSNSIPWSKELAESVHYTTASLYESIKYATNNENSFVLSPTSGFHHAMPHRGVGFCTFSGQVIGSVKTWRECGMRGAYLDLDGHFGNSIPDAEKFQPETSLAISMNFNPKGHNRDYLMSLDKGLKELEQLIEMRQVHYVVWCHGADSHVDDDFVHMDSVDTDHWLAASDLFYYFIKKKRDQGYNVPVVTSLFGGYRQDNYQFVIDLHRQDIEMGIEILEK